MIDILPCYNQILVKIIAQPTTKSAGGIILVDSDVKGDQAQGQQGLVIDIGPSAFFDEPSPRCQVGDIVKFIRYAGIEHHLSKTQMEKFNITLNEDEKLNNGHSSIMFRLIEDRDVRAVIVEPYDEMQHIEFVKSHTTKEVKENV